MKRAPSPQPSPVGSEPPAAPADATAKTPTPTPQPEEMTPARLKKASLDELRSICRRMKLPAAGGRDELLALAEVGLFGAVGSYAGKLTRCNAAGCYWRAVVTGTSTQDLPDGRRVVTRSMQCAGPSCHRFPLKEVRRLSASVPAKAAK